MLRTVKTKSDASERRDKNQKLHLRPQTKQ